MESEKQYLEEDEYINVLEIINSYIIVLQKSWYALLVMIVMAIIGVWGLFRVTFPAVYTATAYYSLERSYNVYTNASLAARAARSVPYLANSSEFRDELRKELGEKYAGGSYSFRAEATTNANLFSVSVACGDAEYAQLLLTGFETIYPSWINRTMGQTLVSVIDESCEMTGGYTQTSGIKKILVAVIGACGLWFVLATLSIAMIRKVKSEEDVKQVLESQCFGILPTVDKKKREKSNKETLLITNSNIDNNYLQAMRSLARRIENYIETEQKKVLMVTSTFPDEGKSLLTFNLATILAHHGKSVLIVDADWYHAGMAKLIQQDSLKYGISDYLTEKTNKISVKSYKSGLKYLIAGTKIKEGKSIVNHSRMESMMASIKDMADIILFDTSATLLSGDSIAIEEFVDGVIYVIRGDYGDIRDIRVGVDPYVASGKMMGYVLNQVDTSFLSSVGNGYGYSKYRNYRSKKGYYGSNYYYRNIELDEEDDKKG